MTEIDNTRQQKTVRKISEPFVIATIPAYGFFLAFNYEKGISQFYGFPISIITISVESIFTATTAILSFLVFLAIFTNMFYVLIPEEKRKYLRDFSILIFCVFMFFTHIILKKPDIGEILLFALFYSFIIAAFYLPPIFSIKEHGGYLNSLTASNVQEHHANRRTIFYQVYALFGGNNYLYAAILVLIIPFVASSLGYNFAQTRTEYPIINEKKRLVVLRIYDKTVVCSSLSEDNKKFNLDFQLRPLTSDSGLEFNLEKIGPLERNK